jgi:hypothetical protein
MNEIQEEKINSSLINIETLQKEYEVVLQEYQESLQNYITSLTNSTNLSSDSTNLSSDSTSESTNTTNLSSDSTTSNSTNLSSDLTSDSRNLSSDSTNSNSFMSLKGRTWWGTKGIQEQSAATEEECKDMCFHLENCTGATFNAEQHYCWMRTGKSKITVGRDDDYALVKTKIGLLSIMSNLNDRLILLNKKITDELKSIQPQVTTQTNDKYIKQQQLNDSYQQIYEQRKEIEKQLQEYNSIEKDEENQYLYVNQKNTVMIMWMLVALILILVVFNLHKIYSFVYYIVILCLILVVLVILSYSLVSPSSMLGLIVLLFLIFFILQKYKQTNGV